MTRAFAVVMAGGRGERLWPLSTPKRPKQFLPLLGERTMLQETVARISPLIPKEDVYVVTPREWAALAREQLELDEENLIEEPFGRNTAPCVGLAATLLRAKDPRGVMVVLPADHVIKDEKRFLEVLEAAIEVASSGGWLLTLGIVPDRPATGYGYIQRGELLTKVDGLEVYRARRFTEKPDEETARRFLAQGDFYWNSGMFIWRVDTILEEIAAHLPKLHAGLLRIREHLGSKSKPEPDRVIEEVYREQESISIDYGVMERSSRVLVIPAEIGWSDVGDWAALGALLPKDEAGNAVQGEHLGLGTERSIIISSAKAKRLIATCDLEGVVIVDTEEALLVMPVSAAQRVRELARRASEAKGEGGR